MNIQIKYSPAQLWIFTKKAFISLFKGVMRIGWAIILLVINLGLWSVNTVIKTIRKAPCIACGVITVFMLTMVAVTHIGMKVKLTTAEWQRDSLELKLDSVKNLYGNKVSYFKYQEYKAK